MPLNITPEKTGFNARYEGNFNKPFPDQLSFFRQKLNVPTEQYDDILKSAHDRAFMVAGAAKADLLIDFREAIDKAIAEGKSLGWFQKEFDNIVAKHGWDYKGGRDWRSRIIYTTNLRASYAAGRYAQLTSPSMLKVRPYWKYVHNDTVKYPRPLHVSWSGLVLKHDDPFWATHFPPNGWGCRCRIEAVKADAFNGAEAPEDGVYTKVDRYGESHTLPKGIDYGWDYAPGAGLNAQNLSEQAMETWRGMKADAWETLSSGNWRTYSRPEVIPADKSPTQPGFRLADAAAMVAEIRNIIGAESKVYSVGGDFAYPVLINAEVLGNHIEPARSPYLPWLDELMKDPYEVWAMFQKHKGTGKTEMRLRIIKRIDTGDKEGLMLIAQAGKGLLEAWTFIPTGDLKYLNRQREGVLIVGK